jgi:hypothetical protein
MIEVFWKMESRPVITNVVAPWSLLSSPTFLPVFTSIVYGLIFHGLAMKLLGSWAFLASTNSSSVYLWLQNTWAIWSKSSRLLPSDHLSLNNAPNLGPLIPRWEINKFENCWYKSVRILKVLNLLFQPFLNLSSSQRDVSGPILGALSNNKWSGNSKYTENVTFVASGNRAIQFIWKLVLAYMRQREQ